MSTQATTTGTVGPESDWEHPTPPGDLIFDDGEPLESNRHRLAMNVLIDSAWMVLSDRPDAFVGGNMFVYYSQDQAMNRDFRGPDFFVALDVDGSRERQGWVIWQEGGRYPDVIVELLSPSTATIDRTVKKTLYERVFRTTDYFIFDPFDASVFEGWHLVNQRYQPLQPDDRGWLWCETLGLWLGTWEGSVRREPPHGSCAWLRFYDAAGKLIFLPEEAERQRANEAQQRANEVQQQANEAQQRANEAQQRANEAQQRAEQAEREKAVLLERLRARGIDPTE